MGARPLRRVIQQKVEDQLSDALLSGTFHDGDNIIVDLNAAGDIILLREEAPAEEAAAEPRVSFRSVDELSYIRGGVDKSAH